MRAADQYDLLYAQDPVISLTSLLQTPLPPVPWDAGISLHWMAIEGKQPAIPENVPLEAVHHRAKRQRLGASGANGIGTKTEPPPQALAVPVPSKPAPPVSSKPAPPVSTAAPVATAAPLVTEEEGALLRAPLRHVVPRELHMYYAKVVKVVREAANVTPLSPQETAVLASLGTDAGIRPLAPYLCNFVATEIGEHLTEANPARVTIVLRAARAMTGNSHLELGPYLHELVPALLTCLLARDVCSSSPDGADDEENQGNVSDGVAGKEKAETGRPSGQYILLSPEAPHWGVRMESARAVAALCTAYPDIAPRVQKKILTAMATPAASLQTLYGAIIGIAEQGPRVVRALLLPNLIPTLALLKDHLTLPASSKFGEGKEKKIFARRSAVATVRAAIVQAACVCVFRRGEFSLGRSSIRSELPASQEKRLRKNTLRLAKVTTEEAKMLVQEGKKSHPLTVPGESAAGGRKRGRGRGGRGRGGRATPMLEDESHLPALSEVFGEEDGEETADEGRAAMEWAQRASALTSMRPAGGAAAENAPEEMITSFGNAFESFASLELPHENYLEEAWREDFPEDQLQRAMEELFESDVLPYKEKGTDIVAFL